MHHPIRICEYQSNFHNKKNYSYHVYFWKFAKHVLKSGVPRGSWIGKQMDSLIESTSKKTVAQIFFSLWRFLAYMVDWLSCLEFFLCLYFTDININPTPYTLDSLDRLPLILWMLISGIRGGIKYTIVIWLLCSKEMVGRYIMHFIFLSGQMIFSTNQNCQKHIYISRQTRWLLYKNRPLFHYKISLSVFPSRHIFYFIL